jgi:hypothetical protein
MDNYVGLAEGLTWEVTMAPNPSEGEVKIVTSIEGSFDLVVRDITGKTIVQLRDLSNGFVMNTRAWAPGTYLVSIAQNNQQFIAPLMVK